MARGDITVFNEALAYLIDGDFGSTDSIKIALVDNTTTPTAADSVPGFAAGATTNFQPNEESGGNVTAGGIALDTLANMVSQTSGTLTFDDTGATHQWAQNASNPTNVYWAIIFNDTDTAKRAIAFMDMGGPLNMTAGDTTVTWHANGIFQVS
jgi:hypothetical protein